MTMANQEINLSGAWNSRYEYGDGQAAEHLVDLRQHGLRVEGASRLDESGSELFFYLRLLGAATLGGDWKELTSKKGQYGGREFQGWVAFNLKDSAAHAKGIWIGPNRDDSEIKSGGWTLERVKR
jgi:hypothetical protein